MNLSQTALDWYSAGIASAVILVLPIAQLALDLNVGALLQLAGELGKLAPGGAAMPFGARVVLALAVFPAGFCRDGKNCDRGAVLCGFQLYVVADEANEGNAVLIHDLNLLFLPCSLAGRFEAGGTCSPGQALPLLSGPKQMTFAAADRCGRAR